MSARSTYDEYTVVQLKQMLKDRELPISGVKTILVQRLKEYDLSSASKATMNNAETTTATTTKTFKASTSPKTSTSKITTPKKTSKPSTSKASTPKIFAPIIPITERIRNIISQPMSIDGFREVIDAINDNMDIPYLQINLKLVKYEKQVTAIDKQRLADGLMNNNTIKRLDINIDINDAIAHGMHNNISIIYLRVRTSRIKTSLNLIPQHLLTLEVNLNSSDAKTKNMGPFVTHISTNTTIHELTIVDSSFNNLTYDIPHVLLNVLDANSRDGHR